MRASLTLAAVALSWAVPAAAQTLPDATTPQVRAASAAFGKLVRAAVDGEPARILVVGQCGDTWDTLAFYWAEPGDKAPRYWGDGAEDVEGQLSRDAIALCDSFGLHLASDRFFNFRWSVRDGVEELRTSAVIGGYGEGFAEWDAASVIAFFGAAAVDDSGIPFKPRARDLPANR